MADVYRYDFTQQRTGLPMRLEIYRSDTNNPVPPSPQVVDIPDDALEEIGSSWQYDTIPLGSVAPVRLKMKWRLRHIPEELARWFLTPYVTWGVTVYDWPGGSLALGATLTNVFQLSVKFPGQTEYQRVYVGVQDPGVPGPRVPWSTKTLELEVEDLIKYTLKQVEFAGLSALLRRYVIHEPGVPGQVVARTCAFDWVYEADPTDDAPVAYYPFAVGNVGRGDNEENADLSHYWFVRWTNNILTGVFKYALGGVMKKVLRSVNSLTNPTGGAYPWADHTTGWYQTAIVSAYDGLRKQTYTTNPVAGAEIGTGFVYVPALITNTATVNSSARINYDLFRELGKLYPSLWDWWADSAKAGYKVAHHLYNSQAGAAYAFKIETYDPAGDTLAGGTPVDVTEFLRDFELEMFARNLKTVTGSTAAVIEADLEKLDRVKAGARADLTYTVPVNFTTAPVAGAYQLTDANANRHGQATRLYTAFAKEDGTINYGFAPRLLGFYYLERVQTANFGYVMQKTEMVRACSWVPVKNHGETPTPPATAPTDPMPRERYDAKGNNAKAIALADQAAQGYMAQTTQKVFDTFGVDNTAVITGTLDLDVGMVVAAPGVMESHLFAFTPYLRVFQVDLAARVDYTLAYFDEAPTTYYMVKCEADLKKGTAKVELYGRNP